MGTDSWFQLAVNPNDPRKMTISDFTWSGKSAPASAQCSSDIIAYTIRKQNPKALWAYKKLQAAEREGKAAGYSKVREEVLAARGNKPPMKIKTKPARGAKPAAKPAAKGAAKKK